MKILSIALRNLASFEGEFEIDFQKGSLSQASLFSIVGPTGSGKSTLLDALCLALFGRTPRLSQERAAENHQIVDSSGEILSLTDPRLILRRNCKEGYAKVKFIGPSGICYEASWEVRRKKGAGLFDKANHIYTDLTTGQSSSIQPRSKEQQIQEFLGLSYDQFCRSVLLAQGQFAAFLQAKGEERAELLETLTGTEIYSKISIQAYQQNKFYQDQIEKLQSRLHNVNLLSPEQIAQIQHDLEELQIQHKQTQVELQKWQSLEKWLEQKSHWEHCLAQSKSELLQLNETLESYAESKLDLAQYHKARSLQADLDRWQWIQTQRQENLKQQGLKQNSLDAQRLKLDEIQKSKEWCAQNWEAQSEIWAKAEPKLNAAEQIHHEWLSLDQVQKEQALKLQNFQNQSLQAQEELDQANAQLSELQTLLNKQNSDLSRGAALGLDTLSQDWKHLENLLNQALMLQKQQSLNLVQIQNLEQSHSTLQQKLQESHNTWQESEQHARQSLTELESLKTQVQSISLSEKRQLAQQDQTKVLEAKTHYQEWQKWNELHHQAQDLSQELLKDRQNFEALDLKLSSTQKELQQQKELSQSFKYVASLELALESQIESLRSHLHADQNCPLCGSLDHPYAQNPEWKAQILESKIQRQQCEATLETLQNQCSILQSESMQLGLSLKNKEILLGQLNDQQSQIQIRLQSSALDHVQNLNQNYWNDLFIRLEQSVQNSSLELKQAENLQSLLQAKAEHYQLCLQNSQKAQQDFLIQQNTLDLALKDLDQFRQNHHKSRAELELIAQKWQSHIQFPPNLVWDQIVQDLESKVPTLQKQVQAFTALQLSFTKTETELKTIQNLVEQKSAIQDHTKTHTLLLQQEFESIRAECAAKLKQIEELWPQGKWAQARQEFKQKLGELENQKAQLQQEEYVQAQALQGIQSEWTQLNQQDMLMKQEADQIQKHLNHQILSLELFPHAHSELKWTLLLECLSQSESMEKLEQTLRQLEQKHTELSAISLTHQQNLEKHLFDDHAPDSTFDEKAWRESKSKIIEIYDQLDNKRTQLNSQLQMHQTMLQTQGGLLQEIEELQSQQSIWKELHDCIGSSDGKKFRTYAQQFTLGILVHQANLQLHRLNPRYQLHREDNSLALVVIDRDLGQSRRPLQSLSGGESFLVSLGLALGLSALSGSRTSLESLFIDEGFGTLDPDTLRIAMDALDALQAQGRKVGIITHVEELKERIPTQVRVVRSGNSSKLEFDSTL